jgi:phosphotransferase system HPr (HPr) family protein
MTSVTVLITNRLGLHARAAAKFVHLANQFPCEITVDKDGETVEAKSILGLLLLAAARGTRLTIRCHGANEATAAAALVELINDRFGEGE